MDNEATHIPEMLKRGSTDALRQVAALYGPTVYALALEITGNRMDAEEITSDTLMKAFRNIASFRPDKGSFKAWILAIAHNAAISAMRRKRPEYPTDDFPENIIDATPDSCDDIELVNEAIDRFPIQDKALIHMYYYDSLSLAEISQITGVHATTLAVRLQRLRQKLKQYILTRHGR
ncbi:MAG: sigma-70 family RNA polymerase sigma factor [Paramuribaculum sp.]|nr:sigma-70 family RNA polymerase sigma factor [Paramuribaculum sp.]MDE7471470.1 sigma-70 family RNA polymerase sigma factor [Paramuribaculum sp.]